MSGRNFLVLLALASCASCRGLSTERPPDMVYQQFGSHASLSDERVSREWVRFSAGWIDRQSNDPIDDAPIFGLDGGFEVAQTVITPSVEFGFSYSPHHVNLPGADALDIARATTGMRLTWFDPGAQFHVRGGAFVRWSPNGSGEPFDPYGYGGYVGAGVDWPWMNGMRLGPEIVLYHGFDHDSLNEIVVTLGAQFRF